MFVDEARIVVRGGHGGHGCVSFRREKFVPRGGPDGGDGGRGGDVIFVADPNQRTLSRFRNTPIFQGGNGAPGQGKKMTGASGMDAVVPVPVGTVVLDEDTGELLADLSEPGQTVVVARGGRGGKGNVHFKSPTRQAPRKATPGEPGEERRLLLTLRLVADVGLVGFPNAGKSTLLSRLSRARPKIADYPFTTLRPHLGVMEIPGEWTSLVLADLPGLIEGAHEGRGLGHRFLRHVQRTRVLLFLIEATSPDPERDLEILRREMEAFHPGLLKRPSLVVRSKADLVAPAERRPWRPAAQDGEALWISSVTGEGLEILRYRLWGLVRRAGEAPEPGEERREEEAREEPSGAAGELFDPATDPKPWPTRWVLPVRAVAAGERGGDPGDE
jgi:GTP-binding protein